MEAAGYPSCAKTCSAASSSFRRVRSPRAVSTLPLVVVGAAPASASSVSGCSGSMAMVATPLGGARTQPRPRHLVPAGARQHGDKTVCAGPLMNGQVFSAVFVQGGLIDRNTTTTNDECVAGLAPAVIRNPDDGGISDARVSGEDLFNLGGHHVLPTTDEDV